MRLTWLHVSDFHFRAGGDPYERDLVLHTLVKAVARFREQGRAPDAVFATGDIAHSGQPAEYTLATPFFDALVEAAGLGREHLYVVPGNHDVDRRRGIGLGRTLASREEADGYFAPDAAFPHIQLKQAAFARWYDDYFSGLRQFPTASTCSSPYKIEVGGGTVGLVTANSALFCQDEDDHAKLWVGRRCLAPALEELARLGADLRIVLLHHPLEWLHGEERANISAGLATGTDCVLNGHLHEFGGEPIASVHGTVLRLAAGAAYQAIRWPNLATYCTYEDGRVTVFPIHYVDSPREAWTLDTSLFPDSASYEATLSLPRFASAAPEPTLTVVSTSPTAPCRFQSNIPSRRNAPFVGRDRVVAELRKVFVASLGEQVVVLHGQPGAGKSELARECARLWRDFYPGGTFLVDFTAGGAPVGLAQIGKTILGLSFAPDFALPDQCLQTLHSLGPAPTLLIYDNAPSADAVEPWLPLAGMPCHVLVTTVMENWPPTWTLCEVPPLPDPDAHQLVADLGGAVVAAKYGDRLVARAAGLPVQLCPAVAAVAYEERRGRTGSASQLASEAVHSFRGVFSRLEPDPQLLLQAAAFLTPQRIPKQELFSHLREPTGWNDDALERLADACRDLHLLAGEADLTMHQLFASFLLETAPTPENAPRLAEVRRLQARRFAELAAQLAAHPADTELAAAFSAFRTDPTVYESARLPISDAGGRDVGRALCETGRYAEALAWYQRDVARSGRGSRRRQVDHAGLGNSLHQMGVCLHAQGQYGDARPYYERAIAEKKRANARGQVDHETLGRSLHQMGVCLSDGGQHAEAIPRHERAVEERERGDMHGRVNHDGVGATCHEIGWCLSERGCYAEASPWYRRAVTEKEQGDARGRVFHASLGRSLRQVGLCLAEQGLHAEALSWYGRAVSESEKGDQYGRVDHTDLSVSLNYMGCCLFRQGRRPDALGCLERAVEESRQGDVHGRVDHDRLGRNLHSVGSFLEEQGLLAQALCRYQRAVEESEQGDVHRRVDHESLGSSLHGVGQCLSKQDSDAEALPWYERAVDAKKQGDMHGRVDEESLRLSQEAVAEMKQRLGL